MPDSIRTIPVRTSPAYSVQIGPGLLGRCGSLLQDMTRVARLDEDMWTELFLADADYLTGELEVLVQHLNEYLDALKNRDAEQLRALLRDGREKKATAGGN